MGGTTIPQKDTTYYMDDTQNDNLRCCQEQGVPDICQGYCETDETLQQSIETDNGLRTMTGICGLFFKKISKCINGNHANSEIAGKI